MEYDFLTKLFGDQKEGEEPVRMTAAELAEAINADGGLQLANLKDGGYVAKEKFDSKVAELNGVKDQLKAANEQIASFSGQEADLEKINQKVAEWETKYNADTEALREKLEEQARSHAEDMFLNGYQFTSKAARNGVLADFRSQNFTLDEDGVFRGGKEYMESLMANEDYKGAFVQEETEPEPGTDENSGKPHFAGSTAGTGRNEEGNALKFDFGFNRLRQPQEKN